MIHKIFDILSFLILTFCDIGILIKLQIIDLVNPLGFKIRISCFNFAQDSAILSGHLWPLALLLIEVTVGTVSFCVFTVVLSAYSLLPHIIVIYKLSSYLEHCFLLK